MSINSQQERAAANPHNRPNGMLRCMIINVHSCCILIYMILLTLDRTKYNTTLLRQPRSYNSYSYNRDIQFWSREYSC